MKKVISIVLTLVLILSINCTALANDIELSPYEKALNSINMEYGVNLGYIPVDEAKVDLNNYKALATSTAAKEKATQDYIMQRQSQLVDEENNQTNTPRATATKTVTKPSQAFDSLFHIQATYTVYDGKTVSKPSTSKIILTTFAYASNTYLTGTSAPAYTLLDTGRTTAVKYIATVHYDSIIGFDNCTIYAEFTANS